MFSSSCGFLVQKQNSLQTLDNNHNSLQHQQQYNLFPSLDQSRYTRKDGAKTREVHTQPQQIDSQSSYTFDLSIMLMRRPDKGHWSRVDDSGFSSKENGFDSH